VVSHQSEPYPPGRIERYGGAADGTTDSTTALENAASPGRVNVTFEPHAGSTDTLGSKSGFYLLDDAYVQDSNLVGPANIAGTSAQVNSMLRLGRTADASNGMQFRNRRVQDLHFTGNEDGSTYRQYNAISFGGDDDVDENAALPWTIDGCFFERCNIGIWKEFGQFGQTVRNCGSSNGNYFLYAEGDPAGGGGDQSEAFNHLGADLYEHGEFSGHKKAAFYLDGKNVSGTGGTRWEKCIIEGNNGFGIFIKDCPTNHPFVIDTCWFENNHQDATVDLDDGVGSRTPRDIYIENSGPILIRDTQPKECELIDSIVLMDGCTFIGSVASFIIGDTGADRSSYRITNAKINQWGNEKGVLVESLTDCANKTGTTTRLWEIPQRNHAIYSPPDSGTIVGSETFEAAGDLQGVSPATDKSPARVQGYTRAFASQYVLSDASAVYQTGGSGDTSSLSGTCTAGKFLVITQEIRLDSGTLGNIRWAGDFTYTRQDDGVFVNDNVGEWVTIGTVAEVESGEGGTIRLLLSTESTDTPTVTLGAGQIIQFDTHKEAVDFFNSRAFAINVAENGTWFDGRSRRIKASDTDTSTDAGLTIDPDLQGFALKAGKKYLVEGDLLIETNSTADFKGRFVFDNSPQTIYIAVNNAGVTGAYQQAEAEWQLVCSTDNHARVHGYVEVHASNDTVMDLHWAQQTSDAVTTSLKAGSNISVTEIGGVL